MWNISCSSLGSGHSLLDRRKTVRTDGNRIDAAADQEVGELRMIARSLVTQADFSADFMSVLNADHIAKGRHLRHGH
jgi:hypothetical protein